MQHSPSPFMYHISSPLHVTFNPFSPSVLYKGRQLYCHLFIQRVIIVAFLENATIGYSLESVCVCVSVRVCVFVCVSMCVCFCMITQKEIDLGTRNRNTL